MSAPARPSALSVVAAAAAASAALVLAAATPSLAADVPPPSYDGKHISAISVVGLPDARLGRPIVVHENLQDTTTGRLIGGALITATLVPDHGPKRILGRARTDSHGRFSVVLPAWFSGRLSTTWAGDRTHTNAVGRYEHHVYPAGSSPVGIITVTLGGHP